MKNYYEILEIDKNAKDETISKIFKYHIKKNHPDLFSGEEKIKAEEKVKLLNEAYDTLSNKEKRAEYDKSLELQESEKNDTIIYEQNILKKENDKLKHLLSNYDKFIHEYFYEKENEVYNIISSYDLGKENLDKQNKTYYKNSIKVFLIKILITIIFIIIMLVILSSMLKINIFNIFFKVFLN